MSDAKTGVYELILDESVRAEDKIPYQSLRNAIEDPAINEIVLIFVGLKHLVEDSVLLLDSMLERRRPGVVLTSKVGSSLSTPDLLLFLRSDRRFILSPHVHFLFRCGEANLCSIDEELMAMGIEPSRKNGIRALDRQRIREMVSEYVDLTEVLDKPLSVVQMGELGLLSGCPMDNLLEGLESAPMGGSRGKI